MSFLENIPLPCLVGLLNYTAKELKEQIAKGELDGRADDLAKNQAFLAVLKKEIAKRLESI